MGLTVSKATPLSLTLVYAVEQLTSSWGKGASPNKEEVMQNLLLENRNEDILSS